MERDEFERRLVGAIDHIVALTRSLVLEPIPDAVYFALAIPAWDAPVPLTPHEVVYSDDPQRFPQAPRRRVLPAELTALLWRDGRIPRWVDLVIIDVADGLAVIQADASPRFTDDPAVEHNPHNEDSPFLVKAIGPPPWIPRSPTHMPLERYSLHWRAGA